MSKSSSAELHSDVRASPARERKGSGRRSSREKSLKNNVKTKTPEIAYEELEFLELIGEGCYGEVWRGRCRQQDVAIKKLHKQVMDQKTLNDFRKEVQIMSGNPHPNVVLFLGACTEPSKMVMVSELIKHGSVEDLIHAPNAAVDVTLRQRIKILQDAAHGINWLHCSDPQIVHRDLKPSNLLIDENWNVKVCDFGLSRIKAKADHKFKDVDSIPGTPLWMAPEVMLSLDLDEKTDVYSFGILAWEILTGGNPFDEFDDYDVFKEAICEGHVRPPLDASVPSLLAHLMQRCWAPVPKDRPSFIKILRVLDRAAVDCMVLDSAARKFWHHNFDGADHDRDASAIEWEQFAPAMSRLFGADGERAMDIELSPVFKCIKELIATSSTDPTSQRPMVTSERFGHFMEWFGPLDLKRPHLFLDRVGDVVRHDWFHGDITSQTANTRLATAPRSSFLVRCSRKTASSEPFTISRKTKEGVICHQRITFNQSKRCYGILVKYKSAEKRDKVVEGKPDGSLVDFIKLAKQKLHLATSAAGSGMQAYFVSTHVIDGYIS